MTSMHQGFMSPSKIYTGVAGLITASMLCNYFNPPLPLDSIGLELDLADFSDVSALLTDDQFDAGSSCLASTSIEDAKKVVSQAALVEEHLHQTENRLSKLTKLLEDDFTLKRRTIATLVALEAPIRSLQDIVVSSEKKLGCIDGSKFETDMVAPPDLEVQSRAQSLRAAHHVIHDRLFNLVTELSRASVKFNLEAQERQHETLGDYLEMSAEADIIKLQDFVIEEVSRYGAPNQQCRIGEFMSEVAAITLSLKDLVKAEEYLSKGEQALTGDMQRQCALTRAQRIFQHAELLASQTDVDEVAAESRYRGAVQVANKYKLKRETATFLGRYASFIAAQGRPEEALKTALSALRLNVDEPAAALTAVNVRHQLGQLDNTEKIVEATQTLRGLRDQLEAFPELEGLREQLETSFASWGKVADTQATGWSVEGLLAVGRECLQYTDVAHVMLCFIAGGAFPGQ